MQIRKSLEKKIKIDSTEDIWESNDFFELEYYFLESSAQNIDESDGSRVFGITIIKKDSNGNEESVNIRNYSYCREETRSLLYKLIGNKVTPVSLCDVLDDIIGV